VQVPLLKVAALYFDKLVILDPDIASGGTIGIRKYMRKRKRDILVSLRLHGKATTVAGTIGLRQTSDCKYSSCGLFHTLESG